MASSALYLGKIFHRRFGDPAHEFSYPVWHALIDLDELPELAADVRGFSHNRFNILAFHDVDHMGPTAEPVRLKLERWLAANGVARAPSRVTLLTQLRLLGSGFNPVSFFFCRDHDGTLQHVVAEVNNTFGDTYCYLLDADGRSVVEDRAKAFHVSPFQPVDGQYRFRIAPPGERISIHINLFRQGEKVFNSTLTETRRPLTTASLARTAIRHPHAGAWTLALIHFQALRLWLKRAPFYSRPEPPAGAWRTRNG